MRHLDKQRDAGKFYLKELNRLLGKVSRKPILALQAWLWFPYSDDVKVNICLHKEGEENPEFLEVQTGRTLPNQNIIVARKRFGKKLSQGFIPVVFDNIEELRKVEKITIIWTIGNGKEYEVIEYDVSFVKPQQKKVYGIASYEYTLSDTLEMIKNKTSEEDIKAHELDNSRIIIGTSMYDDVYFMTHQNGETELVNEIHAYDSAYSIEAFKKENGELPFGVNLILSSFISTNKKEQCVPVTFYHSKIELDDERIVHY